MPRMCWSTKPPPIRCPSFAPNWTASTWRKSGFWTTSQSGERCLLAGTHPTNPMKKILFVDDEPNILAAYQRQLRKHFSVEIAVGPVAGLAALQNPRDFAVVVADMRMPEMNGVEFLVKVKTAAPETVRMMLTGNADQTTAIEAINEGSIFR